MKTLFISFVVVLSGCSKTVIPPAPTIPYPTQSAIAACDPTQGGTAINCLALDPLVRLGVAIYAGVGPTLVSPTEGKFKACQVLYDPDFKNNCAYYVHVNNVGYPSGTGCFGGLLSDNPTADQQTVEQTLDGAIQKGLCSF